MSLLKIYSLAICIYLYTIRTLKNFKIKFKNLLYNNRKELKYFEIFKNNYCLPDFFVSVLKMPPLVEMYLG
jgi:hypothetical protein